MSLSLNSRRAHLGLASVLGAGILALGLASPAAAQTSPAAAQNATTSASTCAVTDGTLTWGVKESFRSYISGTIAKGAWETSEGATYETPEFTWSGAQGDLDASGAGEISFVGAVTFTGHDGLLRTTFANPTLVLGAAEPHLLIDISGVSMEDALAGKTDAVVTQTQVPLVALGLDASALPLGETGQAAASAVAATVTPEGYAAFGNYEAGSAMDPLSFTLQLECTEPVAETAAPEASAAPVASAQTPPAEGVPAAVWWGAGALALLAAAGATVWAVRRQRPADVKRTADTDSDEL